MELQIDQLSLILPFQDPGNDSNILEKFQRVTCENFQSVLSFQGLESLQKFLSRTHIISNSIKLLGPEKYFKSGKETRVDVESWMHRRGGF